jgi:hypothetical protein
MTRATVLVQSFIAVRQLVYVYVEERAVRGLEFVE